MLVLNKHLDFEKKRVSQWALMSDNTSVLLRDAEGLKEAN